MGDGTISALTKGTPGEPEVMSLRFTAGRLGLAETVPTERQLKLERSLIASDFLADQGLQVRQQWDSAPDDFDHFYPVPHAELWVEIADIQISIGTSFRQVATGLIEVAGLQNSSSDAEQKSLTTLVETQTASFLLEGIQQHLVSVGHQLANSAARVAAALPSIRSSCNSKSFNRLFKSVDDSSALPSDRARWPYFSQVASATNTKALSKNQRAIACFRAVQYLHSARNFDSVVSRRGEWFHRLRPDPFTLPGTGPSDAELEVTLGAAREVGEALRLWALDLYDLAPKGIEIDGNRIRLFQEGKQYDPNSFDPSDPDSLTEIESIMETLRKMSPLQM